MLAYTIAGGIFSDTYTFALHLTADLAGVIALIVYIGMEYGLAIPEGMSPFAFEQPTDPAAGAYVRESDCHDMCKKPGTDGGEPVADMLGEEIKRKE